MRRFRCGCGQQLFFENTDCIRCGREVGFDPERLEFVVFDGVAGQARNAAGFRHCRNRLDHRACNWVAAPGKGGNYCLGCSLNDVIPALDVEDNRVLWARLEQAKRRLLYSLLSIGLPIAPQDGGNSLRFRFLEDQFRNPDVGEAFVATGHHQGVITINIREADDVERTTIRQQMCENYRTLLGHFRHETGHYYLQYLVDDPAAAEFVDLFGDIRRDYAGALDDYYRNGATADWQREHISSYASIHPHEDWAEHFAHFLHISDTLETAEWFVPDLDSSGDWISRWLNLSLGLNELNRSLGVDLAYPFVLTDRVIEKLRYVNRRLSLRVGYSA